MIEANWEPDGYRQLRPGDYYGPPLPATDDYVPSRPVRIVLLIVTAPLAAAVVLAIKLQQRWRRWRS